MSFITIAILPIWQMSDPSFIDIQFLYRMIQLVSSITVIQARQSNLWEPEIRAAWNRCYLTENVRALETRLFQTDGILSALRTEIVVENEGPGGCMKQIENKESSSWTKLEE